MPAKALHKVHKHIRQKKGPARTTALHENSRDAQRLRRALARDGRIEKKKGEKAAAVTPYLTRVAFFRDALDESAAPFTHEDMSKLVEAFVARCDPVMESLVAERRVGRPPAKQLAELEAVKEREEREWERGFWVPDLADADVIEKLRGWRGEWSALGNLKFVAITRGGVVTSASFPPD